MAEAIAIVGTTAAILQLTEFTSKVIHNACGLYSSVSGRTAKDEGIQTVIAELKGWLDRLQEKPDQDKSVTALVKHCQTLGNKLLAILLKTKTNRNQSVRESLRGSINSVCKQGEMEDLRKELELCLSQLGVHLVAIFSSDTGKKLAQIYDVQTAEFMILRETLSTVERDHKLALDSLSFLHEILVPSDRHLQRLNQERILKSLAFEGMGQRYADVTDSTIGTFKWCYEDVDIGQSQPCEDDNHRSPNPNENLDIRQSHPKLKISLKDWLVRGQRIFHISGKPGAGKSTLMKFIIESNETDRLLRQWASSRTLVTASFFFWKPGSRLQKSVEGLIRTVVHAILKKVPAMTSLLFSQYWHPSKDFLWHTGDPEIPYSTILEAFEKLTGNMELMKECCFCFFIDGLDELEDRTERDTRLVKRLKTWVDCNPDNLKICVSSREEVPFMANLSPDQRLQLHILTKADIKKHVEVSLGEYKNFQAFSSEDQAYLVTNIVRKAEGVFLWVTLVLRWLGDDIEDGKTLGELGKTLEQVPKELKDVFTKILLSIDREDSMKKAAAILAVLSTANEHRLDFLSTFHYSFIKDFLEDKKFSEKIAVFPLPRSEILSGQEKFTRHLRRLFKGLIEVDTPDGYRDTFEQDFKQQKGSGSGFSFEGTLKVVHQSIHEFLRNDCPKDMKALISDIDVIPMVLQCLIVHLKCVQWDRFFFMKYHGLTIESCLRWVKASQSELHFETLFDLDDVLTQVQTGKCLKNGIDWSKTTRFAEKRVYYRPELGTIRHKPLVSIICWSFSMGFTKYTAWLREQHGALFTQDRTRAEICYCLHNTLLKGIGISIDSADQNELLATLSKDGFLDSKLLAFEFDAGCGLTLWTKMAANVIWKLFWSSPGNIYTALEFLLPVGVDPRLVFKFDEKTSANPNPQLVYFSASVYIKTEISEDEVTGLANSFSATRTRYETLKPSMTFREMIEWGKPKNHEELLRLIDLNLARYGSPTMSITDVIYEPVTDIVEDQHIGIFREEDDAAEDLSSEAARRQRTISLKYLKDFQILPWISGLSALVVVLLAIFLGCWKQPALSESEEIG